MLHAQNSYSTSNSVFIHKIKTLAFILGTTYENLKQLASEASRRALQLALYYLASEMYKYYLDLVTQIHLSERKIFPSFIKETYDDDLRVIPFQKKETIDNTEKICIECNYLSLVIENAYNETLSDIFIPKEQKELLERQLKNLLDSFTRLKDSLLHGYENFKIKESTVI